MGRWGFVNYWLALALALVSAGDVESYGGCGGGGGALSPPGGDGGDGYGDSSDGSDRVSGLFVVVMVMLVSVAVDGGRDRGQKAAAEKTALMLYHIRPCHPRSQGPR